MRPLHTPSLTQHFQHQLASKHPTYYSTMRLGRGLKDRCTKSDSERDVLNGMLEELKNRWNIVRSIVSQRYANTLHSINCNVNAHMGNAFWCKIEIQCRNVFFCI